MKILVTGAAGFIGFHLVKRLLNENHMVVGLDNINDYYDVNLKYARLNECGIFRDEIDEGKYATSHKYSDYRFIKMNLEDDLDLRSVFEVGNFDVVCNLAAQAGVRYSIDNPRAYVQSNLVGFLNILEGCRNYGVRHLVYASSSSVYGGNEKVPFSTKDRVDNPVSLYAATKKSNELMAHSYSHLYKFKTTGLRFFTVYGPWGRPDMAPFIFSNAILNSTSINVFNNGNMFRDFTFIDDIIEGIQRIMTNPSNQIDKYKVYNIGNNSPVKLLDFIGGLEKTFGIVVKKEMKPMQMGDVYQTWADCADLIKDFNYKPSTELINGIESFVKWYKNFYSER